MRKPIGSHPTVARGFSVLASSGRLLAIAVLSWAAARPVAAVEMLCVNSDGSGGCFASLESAVNAAGQKADIQVAAGVYPEPLLYFGGAGKQVSIRGAGAGATVIQSRFLALQQARLGLFDLTVEVPDGTTAVSALDPHTRLELARVELKGGYHGVEALDAGRVDIVDSVIHSNAASGISVQGRLQLLRSLVHSNASHGLEVLGSGPAAKIEDCTFSGNLAAAIEVTRPAKIRGSTVVGSSTVDGGALHVAAGASARIQSSIFSDEASGTGELPDIRIEGEVRSQGFNLVKDPAVGIVPTGRTALDLVGLDPLLGPLLNHGGPTLTHAPSPGSPALEATPSCRRADQTGSPRQPAPCDIGALEEP